MWRVVGPHQDGWFTLHFYKVATGAPEQPCWARPRGSVYKCMNEGGVSARGRRLTRCLEKTRACGCRGFQRGEAGGCPSPTTPSQQVLRGPRALPLRPRPLLLHAALPPRVPGRRLPRRRPAVAACHRARPARRPPPRPPPGPRPGFPI